MCLGDSVYLLKSTSASTRLTHFSQIQALFLASVGTRSRSSDEECRSHASARLLRLPSRFGDLLSTLVRFAADGAL